MYQLHPGSDAARLLYYTSVPVARPRTVL